MSQYLLQPDLVHAQLHRTCINAHAYILLWLRLDFEIVTGLSDGFKSGFALGFCRKERDSRSRRRLADRVFAQA
jgi:hypothetical protein